MDFMADEIENAVDIVSVPSLLKPVKAVRSSGTAFKH